MKIAIIQTHLFWQDPQKNRDRFSEIIESIIEPIDLIVLPEMFTTGFTMQPESVSEQIKGETLQWMITVSKSKNCAITGSIIVSENRNYFNRMLFVYPDGKFKFYDKRHLFTLAGEDKVYSKGNSIVDVEFRGFRLRLQVCYDLRFPVFSRNSTNYDALLYVANWPEKRITAWDALLKARAIENMSYTIGVNRTGIDGNNHQYTGHSQVVDYLGEYLLEPQLIEGVFIVNLNKDEMLLAREKLSFLSDADDFKITFL